MNFKQSFTIICFAMAVSLCCGHIGGSSSYQDVAPQFYCGRMLARAIAFFCYDEPSNEKRSEGTMYNSILAQYYKKKESQAGWPWMTLHEAKSLGFPSRGKRYVVSECCEKRCNVNELLSYC